MYKKIKSSLIKTKLNEIKLKRNKIYIYISVKNQVLNYLFHLIIQTDKLIIKFFSYLFFINSFYVLNFLNDYLFG